MTAFRKQSRFGLFSLFVLICLCPADFLLGQSQKIYFEEVRTPEGQPLGKIVDIAQDKEGFMWFVDESNHRLVRYDGSTMEYFKHDPENPNTPGGFNPFKLSVAPSGEIWIGYLGGGGLDRYDPYTNTFTHYRHDPDDPESIPSNNVPGVFADREGKVLRYVGRVENGKCSVSIEAVPASKPLGAIRDGENALVLHTHYYQPIPLVLRGYGAGAAVTASGVFGDILRTVWRPLDN